KKSYIHLICGLKKSWKRKGGKSAKFRNWLQLQQDSGFRRLFEQNHAPQPTEEAPADLAYRLYRWRLWLAITDAARCYSVIMTTAATALLEEKQVALTAEEYNLFWIMHCCRAELAGLALAFLPLGAMDWILTPQVGRWNKNPDSTGWSGEGMSRL